MNIEKSKSAVVLIEFQNQWTGKGFSQWKTERKYRGKVVNHLKAIDWLN